MKHEEPQDPTRALAARMDAERASLQAHFRSTAKGRGTASSAQSLTGDTVMRPTEPRSLLMKMLLGHPDLVQKVAFTVATTLLGVRATPWFLKLLAFVVPGLRRR